MAFDEDCIGVVEGSWFTIFIVVERSDMGWIGVEVE